jgi:hypothetical protein
LEAICSGAAPAAAIFTAAFAVNRLLPRFAVTLCLLLAGRCEWEKAATDDLVDAATPTIKRDVCDLRALRLDAPDVALQKSIQCADQMRV